MPFFSASKRTLWWQLFLSPHTRGMDIHRMVQYDEPRSLPSSKQSSTFSFGKYAYWVVFIGLILFLIGIGLGFRLGQVWG
jgi:hypothetical protein